MSLLGSGGMGKVYLACDEDLAREVALKVLREQYIGSAEFVERFEREARAAASLNYPNIVQVYDRGETGDGTYYIAMEYVPGGTLKDRILETGSIGQSEAIRLAVQVADALGVAHASGIVHRDVKPQNVLLTAAGDAKVADFGIARAASEASLSNSSLVLGTAKYMSPEQALGDPVGPESDLYSLGVVLYEMLTGEVPFEADSSVGVAMKHVMEPPRPPKEKNPTVPDGLDAVVMKLLQKKPEDRYPGAAELVADLRRLDEGLPPIFAPPPTSWAGTTEQFAVPAVPVSSGGNRRDFSRSSTRRRRAILMLCAAVLVALLAALGLGFSRGYGGPVVGSLGKVAEEAQQALGVGYGEVPKVVGLTEEEARERLAAQGFGVAVERRESAEEDEGKVLEQSAPAGKEVERGSRIVLAVGSGPGTLKVPDLVGLTLAEAERKLLELGLKPGERDEALSEEAFEGEVTVQNPPVGEKTKPGTEVDLTIGIGPPKLGGADRVEVPDVSGLDVGDATALLRGAGCEVAGTITKPSPEPEGTVLGTDPPIGSAVESGAPVILVVSGGAATPPAESAPSRAPAGEQTSSSASASASPEPAQEPAPSPEPPSSSAPPESPDPSEPAPPSPSSPSPTSPTPSSPAPSAREPAASAPPASSTSPSPSATPEQDDGAEGSE